MLVVRLALLAAFVVSPSAAAATSRATRDVSAAAKAGKAEKSPPKTPSTPAAGAAKKPLSSYGSISVGHPDVGFLINGVQLPSAPYWLATAPSQAFGTRETIDQLGYCVRRVRAQFADTPPVRIGSISKREGGAVPPHKSHRTGRDADVYFYRKPGAKWFDAAREGDIDLPRTWALLRCFVSETDIDFVLIDRKVQGWLERYALRLGEPREWVQRVFHDGPGYTWAAVRHAPGHVAHMHVRFVSAASRRRGSELYARLAEEGLIKPPYAAVQHRVSDGETLVSIAKKYKTSVQQLQALNRLSSTHIKSGQALVISRPRTLRGVFDPIRPGARRRAPKQGASS